MRSVSSEDASRYSEAAANPGVWASSKPALNRFAQDIRAVDGQLTILQILQGKHLLAISAVGDEILNALPADQLWGMRSKGHERTRQSLPDPTMLRIGLGVEHLRAARPSCGKSDPSFSRKPS